MAIRIAVASGKGRTGKTTVATNLFRTIKRDHGNHVLLVACPSDAIRVQNEAIKISHEGLKKFGFN